ncbi:MAG: fimbrillin family protein, partial [Alistipes sp.]|nr:fimbrillin family protein [Alistipes sp.]
MKNEIIYCLAALAMIGCADDAGVNALDESAGAVRFSADAPSTRVAYEQTETSYRVEWVKNDRIGIFGLCAGASIGANISYTALESAAASDFAASAYSRRIRWADDASSHDFYAYYPYAEDAGSDPTAVSVSIPAVQEQSDLSSAHLAAYDILYASATDLVKGDNSIDLPFRHLGAVIEVRLTTNLRAKLEALIFRCVSNPAAAVSVENAALDLTTGKLDLTKAVTSPEVRLTAPLNTSDSEPVSLYLAVNPGHAGERFEVVAVINGKEYAVTAKPAPDGR